MLFKQKQKKKDKPDYLVYILNGFAPSKLRYFNQRNQKKVRNTESGESVIPPVWSNGGFLILVPGKRAVSSGRDGTAKAFFIFVAYVKQFHAAESNCAENWGLAMLQDIHNRHPCFSAEYTLVKAISQS